MSRRIEVELTSDRGDGSWTWRAAGAREPRGVVDGSLVPSGSKVGEVLRAEADIDLDGVTITAFVAAPQKHRNEAERIEIIGQPVRDEQLVTSTLAPRDKRDRPPRRDRGERGDRDSGPPRDGAGRPPREGRPDQRTSREGRPAAREGDRRPPRDRPDGTRERRPPRPPRVEEPAKPKPKRLRPARAHRSAVLESLPPEHRPIAEQVLLGDIPAVRQAIDEENKGRVERGETAIDGAQLLAIAERLRPQLRAAEWRDKAEAALAVVDELDLRDLRSVVVAADRAARDDETRALGAQLREALTRRVDEEHAAWLAELSEALDSGRAVRALRLSSRPPKAGTLFPTELSARLAEAASASLTADAAADRWAIVLDAVAHSPVRLAVKPQSLPAEPSEELLTAVRKLSSRMPDIAALFGIAPAAERSKQRGPKRPPKPVLSAQKVDEVERVVQEDVADEVAGADVPAGDREPAPDVQSAPAVVLGVADEHDVVGAEAEPVEDEPEVLPSGEGVSEEGDLGTPAEASELDES